MNKIYKVVWSKVKNCYVVVSELAKNHMKFPKSGVFSRTLFVSVLASFLCIGVTSNVFAMEVSSLKFGPIYYESIESSNFPEFSLSNELMTELATTANITIDSFKVTPYTDVNNNLYFEFLLRGSNGHKYVSVKDSELSSSDLNAIFSLINTNELHYYQSSFYSISNGVNSNASGDNSVAIGRGASSNGNESIAIGKNATASATNSVALGSNSVASVANTVSVGTPSSTRKIVNVANGSANTDVATYGQVKGNIKDLSISGKTITYTKVDGTTGTITTQDNDTTYSVFTGATSSVAGSTGLVPAPAKGAQNYVLHGDGTWAVDNDTTYTNMSASELSTGTATTARSISAKVVADYVTGKVSAETTARADADTALGSRIDESIKALSVCGTTITYTKGDGTTGTITTQDKNTTYTNMSATELNTGTATTARTISAKTIADYVTDKVSTETTARNTAISSEATARADADTALGSRIDESIKGLSVNGKTITYTKGDGTTGTITTQDTNTTYAAGNGVALSGTTFSAKAGTNVSVDSNGINVVGNGLVASGNTGLVSGGTLFTENRIIADGTFAKKANTTAANITALDTAAKNAIKALSVSGQTITYTKGDGTTGTITTQDTNTTYSAFTGATSSAAGTAGLVKAPAAGDQNKFLRGDGTWAVDNDTKYTAMTASEATTGTSTTARSITAKVLSDYVKGQVSAETTARTSAVSSEATTRADADTALGTRIDNVITAYESADTGLSNRIGSLSADGNYIKKSATNNVSANLSALDTQLKTTATAVSTETTNRTNADTALSNRIGSVASNGNYIKASSTKNVAENLGLLDTQVKANATAISNEVTNRTTAVSNEASARESADTALGTRIDDTIKDLSVSGRTITYTKGDGTTGTITTQDSNTTYDAISASELSTGTATTARTVTAKVLGDYVTGKVSAETTARTTAINSEATTRANADTELGTRIDNVTSAYQSADTALGNRIGTLSADGNYIKKSATNNVSANLTVLDTQLKTTATAVGTETTNRTNADTALSNRIGSVASDGTFIKKSATNDVAANLTALDTAAKNSIKDLSVSGTTITYTKGDGTTGTITTQDKNTTYTNMSASELETGTVTTARTISAKVLGDYVTGKVSAETTARTTAINSEASTRQSEDTALSNRIGSLSADGNYIKKSATNNVSANLSALDTQLKTTTTAISTETTNRTNADTALGNRIGTLSADGNYIKKSDTKNVSENLSLLDAQVKANATAVSNEVTNRTTAVTNEATARESADTALGTRIDNVISAYQSADTGLSNRIGSVASDGTFIKKSATNNVAANLTALDTAAKNAIKGLSVSGTTITYTKGDGTTGTITTQDNNTTYDVMSASELSTGTATTARSISAKVLADYVKSRVGDSTVSTGSTGSTAVGDSSVVTGNNSVSVGDNSSVTGTGSVSVGTGSSVEGDSNVSIGNNGSVNGSNSVAIGSDTETTESDTVAVGGGSSATGEGAVSLGAGTSAKGDNSTALGNNSYSANDNSVALGSNAVASASDVVSVGHKAGDTDAEGNVYTTNEYRRIINVANGVNANDAATVGQMNTAINTETSARTVADTALGARIDGTIKGLSVNGRIITYTKGDGTTGTITTQDTTYSAGNGLSLSNGSFSVKTDGQVASGNTGIVTGGTVYDALEARIGQITVENNAQNTVAVGDNSSVSGDGAVAVGSGSSGSGESSVAVGDTSNSSGDGSVAVGSNTTAESDNTVVIGAGSTVSGTDSDNSVAIGQQTNVTGSDSVALGGGSSVTGTESTAVGGNTVVNNTSSVALGYDSNASQDNVVSVGHKATDIDSEGHAYGSDLTRRIVNLANGTSATDAATVGQTYVIQNGTNTTVTEAGTNAIGQKIYQMTVNTDGQVVSGNTGIVTGGTVYDALEARIGAITVENNAQNTVAVGDGSSVSGDGAIAVGTGSAGSGEGSVAVGDTSNSSGDGSVAVGSNTTAESDNTVVIGAGSTVTGTDSDNSVAIGQQTNVAGSDSVAVGGGSSVTGTESTAIGGNAVVNNNNSVALGFGSNASDDNVISVGHKATDIDSEGNVYGSDLTRRIVNLAAGTSATDAATVGQTYVLQNGTNTTVTENGTNSIGQKIYKMTVNTDGQVVSGNTGIVTGGTVYDALEARIGAITVENNAQNTVAVGDGSSVSGDGAIAVGTGSAGSGEGSVAVGNTSTSTGEGSVAVGSNTTAESDNTVVIGAGSIVSGTDSGNSVAIGQQTSVTGSDSVALGGGSSITGTESTAVGGNTVVNNDNSVALGFDSNASDDNVVSVGHKASDKDSANQEYGTDLFRRIINVADAVNEHDAVTKGQLDTLMTDRVGSLASNGNYVLKDNTISANLLALDTQLKATDISTIKYDGTDRALATLGGTNGTKLTNLKAGILSATSTDAVTGAQLYATNQSVAGFASDINRNKTNIANLNTSVTAALGTVSSTSTLVSTLDGLKADASLNNLTVAGRNVIAAVAANAVQEYMALQQNNYVPPTAPMMYSNNPNTLNVTNAGNGSLYVGEGSNVNGSSSIAIGVGNQVNANNSGAFGDPSIINADESYVLGNDDTINTGATGSFVVGNDSVSSAKGGLTFGSNNVLEDTAENSVALGNNVNISGKNSVALGSGSTAVDDNVISVGNDTLKRKITNVANGNIAEDSTDAVTGSQLFATNERVKANEDAIATKANLDASNIDVDSWTAKLGTGTVEDGNTGLVNGGTVFNAIQQVQNNQFIQQDGDVLNIGGTVGGSTINVANNAGEGRVITGVVTDPDNPYSATNVGYVQSVSENIVNAVNNSLVKVDRKVNKVGANAAALASLTPASFEGDEKWSLAASFGHYEGQTAGAVGAFYKPAENVMMNLRGSFASGENMFGGGVAVSLSKGDVPGVTKRQLATKVNRLEQTHEQDRNQIAQLNQHIVQQDERIAELENLVQNMAKQMKAGK